MLFHVSVLSREKGLPAGTSSMSFLTWRSQRLHYAEVLPGPRPNSECHTRSNYNEGYSQWLELQSSGQGADLRNIGARMRAPLIVSKRTAVSSGPHDRFGDSRPSARVMSVLRPSGRGVDPRPALRALEWTVGRGAGSDGIRLGLRLRWACPCAALLGRDVRDV